MHRKLLLSFLLVFIVVPKSFSADEHFLTVSKDGPYKTVSEALASLPMFNYERVVILVKPGVYNEKIRIDRDYVTIRGENRDSTIIEYSQLRTDWMKNPDSTGPAIVNIHADDVVLENLTIENTQPEIGPHAFAVYGDGTRTVITNCNILSKGGDTVSLWDYKTGMYYLANCKFQGAVDMVCPRGWCFIKDSKFFEMKSGSASIWHAGGYDRDQKLVILNSTFDGVKGFELGRHHYEAQFYLLHCYFSADMADKPIYRVTYSDSTQNRPFNWGERDYFYDCSRYDTTGDTLKAFPWYGDNLGTADGSPLPGDITPAWTFGGKWNPLSRKGPKIVNYELHDRYVLFYFSEPLTVIGDPVLESRNGTRLKYDSGAGSVTLRFDSVHGLSRRDIDGLVVVSGGRVAGTIAGVYDRDADFDLGGE